MMRFSRLTYSAQSAIKRMLSSKSSSKVEVQAFRKAAFVCDPELADDLVKCLPDLTNKHVLEINPGPGCTTKALLKTPALTVDVVEPYAKHYNFLTAIEKESGGRMRLHKGDYHKVDLEEGCPPSTTILSRVPRHAWHEPCPLLIFGIAPVKYGLRYVLSWLYKIASRDSAFHWGRVDSYLLYPAHYAEKIVATAQSKCYGRVAVLAQVLCDVSVITEIDRSRFEPALPGVNHESARLMLVRIIPKPDVQITQETVLYLDYIVRMLINARQRPLPSLLKTLGPGGDELLELAKLDPKLTPMSMTPDDYMRLTHAFAKWPSKPTGVTCYAELD